MPAARSAAVGIVFASLGVQPEGTIIAGFEKGGLVDVKVEVNESSESARLLAERLVGIVRWNCVPDPTPAGTTELIGLTYIVVREVVALALRNFRNDALDETVSVGQALPAG
jgi:hypothetical protein